MICKLKPGLIFLLFCFCLFTPAPSFGQKAKALPPKLPTMREQAEIQQQWLKLRLDRVLPELMRKHGVSMWLVICREYNEDPVFRALTSPTVFAARRRTILVFYDQGREKGVERLALGGGSNGGLYSVYRDPERQPRTVGRRPMGAAQKSDRRPRPEDDRRKHLAHPRLLRRPVGWRMGEIAAGARPGVPQSGRSRGAFTARIH